MTIKSLIQPQIGKLSLLVAPYKIRNKVMHELLAIFATKGPVRLLLGNNRLDIHRLAAKLYKDPDAMSRITIERAFTGPQTMSMISRLKPSPSPTIIDGPLDTFFDEAIKPHNRQRYLKNIIAHLALLSKASAVLLTLKLPDPSRREDMAVLETLQKFTDQIVWFDDSLPDTQLPLF